MTEPLSSDDIRRVARSGTDVCVVGGGIAGALTAMRMAQAGIKVVILEAGPRHAPGESFDRMQRWLAGDDPWQSNEPERDVYVNAGPVDYELNAHRVKAVGGSTMHWAGYTPRFMENDFRMRSRYGICDDWPISYSDLEPYYAAAERELGVAGAMDNPFSSYRSSEYPLPAFPIGYDEKIAVEAARQLGITFHSVPQARTSEAYRGRSQCLTFGVCNVCPIRARYSGDIHIEAAESTGNVIVIPEASVVRLEVGADPRKVESALFITSAGEMHAISASVFVVAAHAVESSRLLLLSESPSHPEGLANSSGLVGRYFMEHRSQHRIVTVTEALYPQRKGFATAFSQQFHDPQDRDEASGIIAFALAAPRSYESLVQGLARRSGNWGEAFAAELEARVRTEYHGQMLIRTSAEPMPSEENCVDLDPQVKDSFGNPAPRLHYAISDYEQTGYRRGRRVIDGLADALGAVATSEIQFHFGSHHAGTCRMGEDSRRSVVDRNLKTHDLDNAFVIGSSVFVTLSLVNPTLTIAALALRLGDHLVESRTQGLA